MMWKRTYIFFIAAIVFTAGHISAEGLTRILGGKSVLIQNYPYQASLRQQNNHFCGGSIISERHILTAAHCIKEDTMTIKPFDDIRVVTATSYSDKRGQSYRISKIDVHPDWTPLEEESYRNDIAVITLKSKITFNDYQRKIDLPKRDFVDGRTANLTGWGLTSENPNHSLKQLQWIETVLVSRDKCQNQLSNAEKTKIYDTQVCSLNDHGSGACLGDSGGPLVVNGELVGVVSWVDGDYCAVGLPVVYTNVYKYNDYIENILNNFE